MNEVKKIKRGVFSTLTKVHFSTGLKPGFKELTPNLFLARFFLEPYLYWVSIYMDYVYVMKTEVMSSTMLSIWKNRLPYSTPVRQLSSRSRSRELGNAMFSSVYWTILLFETYNIITPCLRMFPFHTIVSLSVTNQILLMQCLTPIHTQRFIVFSLIIL